MCFSLAYIVQLLILFVVIAATVAIVRILVPWICGVMGVGVPGPILQILGILLWAVVIICVILLAANLLGCLLGGHLGLLPRG